MRWVVGENDTADNSDEGFDGRGTSEYAENWYSGQGWDTDIDLVRGKSHLLNGLYGGYLDDIISESNS